MNCQEAKPLIEPYADGELDAARILELERHLRTCSACAQAWSAAQSLQSAIRQDALFHPAPAEIRGLVLADLRAQVKDGLNSPDGAQRQRNVWKWNWPAFVSTFAAAACLLLALVVATFRPSAQQRLAREIVSSHVRSLMVSHALDVASSDQHTVKPWFNGKLDFAPPVKDLAAQEFPLVGGRLDYIGDRPVAALVFQRHKHTINLFIWPANETKSPPSRSKPMQGYNLIHWSDTGMVFWAVSDLNEKELSEFANIYAAN